VLLLTDSTAGGGRGAVDLFAFAASVESNWEEDVVGIGVGPFISAVASVGDFDEELDKTDGKEGA
jgi:hypothetical protein